MLYLLYLCYILFNKISSSEVITLIKDNNVKCVLTEETVFSGLYIAQDFETSKKERLFLEFVEKVSDIINATALNADWNTTFGLNSLHAPVIDERWTSFRFENIIRITEKISCFSIYAKNNTEYSIRVYSKHMSNKMEFKITSHIINCGEKQLCSSWRHYAIIRKNNSLEIWGKNYKQNIKTDFTPDAITMVDASSFKVHDYTFQSSTKITDKQQPLKYPLLFKTTKCVEMFVSVDKNCALNISLESNIRNFVNTLLVDNTNNDSLRQWQRVQIRTDFLGEFNLSFSRIRSDNKTTGYWAVDNIQFCAKDIEVYSAKLNTSLNAPRCETLNNTTQSKKSNKFCDGPGYLGVYCNISCSQVLGNSYSYCDNYKICTQDGRCHCAWGYSGIFCTEKCKSGSWGIDCKSFCGSECKTCDYRKGCISCIKKKHFGAKCSKKYPISLQSPELTSITENSITITLGNIEYDPDEARPEFYQIQYKKVDETIYKNYSNQIPFPSFKHKTYTINQLATKTYSYQIRALLIVQNQSYSNKIPELVTFKKTLTTSNMNNGNLILQWEHFQNQSSFRYYNAMYKCLPEFSINETFNHTTNSMNINVFLNLTFSTCNITLFASFEDAPSLLIDEISINTANMPSSNKEEEMLRKINLVESKIVLQLIYHDYFQVILKYHFKFSLCTNEVSGSEDISFNYYKNIIKVELPTLKKYFECKLNMTAGTSKPSAVEPYLTSIAPKELLSIKNLAVYSRNESALWIRWKISDRSDKFKIQFKLNSEIYREIECFNCSLWENFLCATITGLRNNTVYNVTVVVTSLLQRGIPTSVRAATKQEAPEAPQNFSVKLISYLESSMIILNWSHPMFTNGPLKSFEIRVKIKNAIINEYNYPISEYHREYQYYILINYLEEYTISVNGRNHFEGRKATLNVTIIRLIVEDSYLQLVEACSKTCVLIIPNLLQRLEILVLKRSTTYSMNLTDIYDSIKNKSKAEEEGWIIEPSVTNLDNLKLEIDKTKNSVVSIKNQTYIMYLSLFNSTTQNRKFYSIEHQPKIEAFIESYKFLFIILFINICWGTLAIITMYYYKHKQSSYAIQNLNEQTGRELMSLHNIPQSIGIKNFESQLKNPLASKNLVNQFQSISETQIKSSTVALQRKNNNKNKDRCNIPYDCSRIVLEKMEGVGSDDYINASYIDGYDRPKAYIACQGPKFSTVKDFWRMIWQEKIETIVMAGNFIENQKRMSAEYWPQTLDTIFECGEISIKLVKEELYEYYVSRVFKIYYMNEDRKILQLHLSWSSDEKNLFYPNHAVAVVKRIRQIYERDHKPIVIHSGLGANRTGTLILCNQALQMAKIESELDFHALTKTMREQRPNMVNTLQHYIIAHLIVLECILEEEYPFKNSLEENMRTDIINQQLQYLERLCWVDRAVQSWMPQRKPLNSWFNPVLVDGYGKIGKYLVIKQPIHETVVEFWNMVSVESIRCILFLNSVKHKNQIKLWPSRNISSKMIIKITERRVTIAEHCTITELLLLAYEKSSGQVKHEHKIFFFELHDWKSKHIIPDSTDNILRIIKDISKVSQSQRRILVACKNGFSASGLFAALSYSIEKYQRELEIDVCNAVRIVRRSGSQFLNNSKQLKFMYTSILDYLKKFESYERIEE